jgi:hypothetical protein
VKSKVNMEMVATLALFLWPVIMGLIAKRIVNIPHAFFKTTCLGYALLFLSAAFSAVYVFLYYKPLVCCMSAVPQPAFEFCTSLPSVFVKLLTDWNFVAANGVGIIVVIFYVYRNRNKTKTQKL